MVYSANTILKTSAEWSILGKTRLFRTRTISGTTTGEEQCTKRLPIHLCLDDLVCARRLSVMHSLWLSGKKILSKFCSSPQIHTRCLNVGLCVHQSVSVQTIMYDFKWPSRLFCPEPLVPKHTKHRTEMEVIHQYTEYYFFYNTYCFIGQTSIQSPKSEFKLSKPLRLVSNTLYKSCPWQGWYHQ